MGVSKYWKGSSNHLMIELRSVDQTIWVHCFLFSVDCLVYLAQKHGRVCSGTCEKKCRLPSSRWNCLMAPSSLALEINGEIQQNHRNIYHMDIIWISYGYDMDMIWISCGYHINIIWIMDLHVSVKMFWAWDILWVLCLVTSWGPLRCWPEDTDRGGDSWIFDSSLLRFRQESVFFFVCFLWLTNTFFFFFEKWWKQNT